MTARDPAELIREFIAPWNLDDPDERRRRIVATCAPEIEARSPYGITHGIEEQLTMIANFRRTFPRGTCTPRVLSAHPTEILFAWRTTFGDGHRPDLTGIDVVRLDAEGRIALTVSFSPVPPPPE
jgi:hypothetical protein